MIIRKNPRQSPPPFEKFVGDSSPEPIRATSTFSTGSSIRCWIKSTRSKSFACGSTTNSSKHNHKCGVRCQAAESADVPPTGFARASIANRWYIPVG